jgi:GGDEF-like domain/PucR C-terminal helix-turn-helix domain
MLALGAETRAQLVERLRSRRGEIEQTALARVRSVSDPEEIASPEYREGLRVAVSAALEYGIEALSRSEDRPAPIPTALLSQARLAARNGVELDTVLRRYLAGHTLLDDFLVEEAEREGPIGGAALKRLLRAEAAALDRLLAAVSEEYMREAKAGPSSPEQRRAKTIERLLAGEPLDTAELAYDFEGDHLGLVASGPGALEVAKALSRDLDARLLIVPREEGQVLWAWLGSRRRLDPAELLNRARDELPDGLSLAIGEPGEGLAGWRLSHRQAEAALAVALRGQEPLVRYADVALLALAMQDELLATSLRELYLEPLAAMAGGGERLRETLRAYIATGANTSSTAAALGIDRRTVTRRIRMIEDALGHSLTTRVAEMEVALRLWEFEEPSPGRDGTK